MQLRKNNRITWKIFPGEKTGSERKQSGKNVTS